uniref:Transmembrane protein n=1 Tax=Syphacia muris TaxID=451379 RepID=A0A0N5AXU3_9BILA
SAASLIVFCISFATASVLSIADGHITLKARHLRSVKFSNVEPG